MATREEKFWQHYHENKVLRQAPRPVKKSSRSDKVRRRDWTSDALEDPDVFYELDVPDRERIVPRGETERKSSYRAPASPLTTASSAGRTPALAEGNYLGAETPSSEYAKSVRGTVIQVSSALCQVQVGDRAALCLTRTSLKGSDRRFTNVVAVGDEVMISLDGGERGMVEAVLPRRSALARPDTFHPHLQQVIVANVDQVLIVASWREPAFWPELLDRYLIAAERHGLTSIVCVNKVDLAEVEGEPQAAMMPYARLGYQVLFTSAQTGAGIAELREILRGRTTALAGLSGVGKSSLLAMAEPGLNLRISEVSERHHEGKHTTTQATLHPLRDGGFVVDTPGIREFGLSGLRRGDLGRHYAEISAVAGECRFPNCSHTREPDCAIKIAVRGGRISAMRYDSYRKIYRSLPE